MNKRNKDRNQIRILNYTNLVGESSNHYRFVDAGEIENFIQQITLPSVIEVGEEIVSKERPFLILTRRKSMLSEIFSSPSLSYTKKLRIKFHWNGLQVLGSHMESPNCFIFDVPAHNTKTSWYLKLSCLPDCTPGEKPLYISVDAYKENIIIKSLSVLLKIVAVITFLLTLALPFIYYLSDSVRAYINQAIFGEAISQNITLIALILFSFILLSRRLDEIFTTILQKPVTIVLTESGTKMINFNGVLVEERSENQIRNRR